MVGSKCALLTSPCCLAELGAEVSRSATTGIKRAIAAFVRFMTRYILNLNRTAPYRQVKNSHAQHFKVWSSALDSEAKVANHVESPPVERAECIAGFDGDPG